MINAGAIVTSSLIAGDTAEEKFDAIARRLDAFAGRELDLDESVFESEHATGDRNRALAYLLRSRPARSGRPPRWRPTRTSASARSR